MAEAAGELERAAFVLISTDKAVNPTSVMGQTKRMAEWSCQLRLPRRGATAFLAVRFGNVLASRAAWSRSSSGRSARRPVTVTAPRDDPVLHDDSRGGPAGLQAGAIGERGDIFVLDMGEPVRILDLAHEPDSPLREEPGRDIAIEFTACARVRSCTEELWADGEEASPTRTRRSGRRRR